MMRAIYTGDMLSNFCPVFEFNVDTKKFHMIEDKEVAYSFETVMDDIEWIVCLTDGDSVYSAIKD